MNDVFKGLKVIELASVLAGPSVGMFFAELGAKVLKIENKITGGDVTRSWKLPNEDPNSPISAYYSAVNWHKEVRFMDFTSPVDQLELRQELIDTDILIVNFKNGDSEKFGLDYPRLKINFPALIYGEITGFGADSDRVAYDLILQAETGFMSMNGTADSGPIKMPLALIDVLAGHQLKTGLTLALYERDLLNLGGCSVTVSLYDAAIASLANQATNWLMTGHIPGRIGSAHPNIAPYGDLFKTKDDFLITFAIGSDKQFKKLCKILGIGGLAEDPLFIYNALRVENRMALWPLLNEAIINFEADVLLAELEANFVPAARIKNMKEVFETPSAKKLILEETIEGQATKRPKTVVFKVER